MEPADIVLYYCDHQMRVIVVEAGFVETLVLFLIGIQYFRGRVEMENNTADLCRTF